MYENVSFYSAYRHSHFEIELETCLKINIILSLIAINILHQYNAFYFTKLRSVFYFSKFDIL